MKERILTALVGIPIVLVCVFCTSPWPIGILVLAAATIALQEAGALGRVGLHWAIALLVATIYLGSLGFRYVAGHWEQVLASYCLVLLHLAAAAGTALAIQRKRPRAYLFCSSIYIGLPMLGLLYIHSLDHPNGLLFNWDFANLLLILVLPIWAGDTAAIFAGKYLGRHKLAEAISPKKTWEGAIANLVAAIGTALLLSAPLAVPLPLCAAIGVVCGVLGQVGDLFESWIKRQADAKDSGSVLPGHGGVLDRIDSLLLTALPVFAIIATARYGFPW